MWKRWVLIGLLLAALDACAHKGAIRVHCDGVLRPINSPDASPPVSVDPVLPESDSRAARP